MFCSVCYTSSLDNPLTRLPCFCVSCSDCLTSWIVTQILELHYQTHENIQCLNATCKRPFKVQDVYNKLTQEQQDVINTVLFDVYLKKTDDVRKCPNNECSYAGVITTIPCSSKLECPNCSTQWREKIHHTTTEKIRDFVLNYGTQKNEVLSDVWQEAFARRCPKCSVSIQKNGGCNHMTCKRCQYEFCWLCNQPHKGHKLRLCHVSCIAKFMLMLLPLLNLFWLTGIGQIIGAFVNWTCGMVMGGVIFNILALVLFALFNMIQKTRRVVTKRRKRETELACFGLAWVASLLMGIINCFGLYFNVGQVACIEILVGIVFQEHMRTLRYYLLYLGDLYRYLKWNRRIILVYIKSYFIR